MKNIKIYYIAILLPLIILFTLRKFEIITWDSSLISFLIYVFVYRTYTDGKRLLDKKIILKKDLWKILIPGTRIEYFKELYIK
ncbi:MAG: hypothetical protein ACOH1N_01215 [Lutibacter sp.]